MKNRNLTAQYDRTLLVTGGCGFIGSNLIRFLLARRQQWRVVNVDSLTYASNPANLSDLESDPRYTFVEQDISEQAGMEEVFQTHTPWAVINCAAESHVDRSLEAGVDFVRTNVLGAQVVLELGRKYECRVLQMSTDEVYGSLDSTADRFREDMPLEPTSPYAASKASADMMILAAFRSYGQDVIITRSSNNYGPYQHPEKLIPLMISNVLDNQPLPVYGQGKNVRDWIHVGDHCRGILAALERGSAGSIYNLGGDSERTNISVVRSILSILGRPESLIRYVQDRPGHDQRYAIDFTRSTNDLDWVPETGFEEGLRETVTWYVENDQWWRSIKDGGFQTYYERQYAARLKDSR
jgi:dTDP-glucose 4,6-dehydratase